MSAADSRSEPEGLTAAALAPVRARAGITARFARAEHRTALDRLSEHGGYRLKFPQAEADRIEGVIVNTDIFGSLQTAAGAYLGVFIVSHLIAVFALGRQAMQVDTNWDFATAAPAGLMGDPWNVRLVPHYSLAVFLLFAHLACGVRMVLLGRRVSASAALKTAVAIIALGAAVALAVTLAMLGVHMSPTAIGGMMQ